MKWKGYITLYYLPYCPYSQHVLVYLEQIGKTLNMKNLQKDPLAKEELQKIGGKMQVPCLIVDQTAIYDDQIIIQWISEHQYFLKNI